ALTAQPFSADVGRVTEETLGLQLQLNRTTWQALCEHGVQPGQALDVDVFYAAPGEEAARRLAVELTSVAGDARVGSTRSGLLRRRQWSVTGSLQLSQVSIEVLDAFVEHFVGVGARHGCEFDGWGAQL
ncbi:ribonuclease E inhibitor RraB, partial [Enterococcus hirae]|uniref:ribonuclease E inhibitor RraB n=1 Tax=Enterococcus hirae TaxID=1354 RepID=UPI0013AB4857